MGRKPNGRPRGPVPRSPFERAISRVDTSDPDACWIWPGAMSRGYGKVGVGGSNEGKRRPPAQVHRVVYEGMVGSIPEGMELDHLCRVRACCNPRHLEPVTHRENGRRGFGLPGINARKDRCVRDHFFDTENTYITSSGTRTCRRCHRDYEADRRARQRAAVAA